MSKQNKLMFALAIIGAVCAGIVRDFVLMPMLGVTAFSIWTPEFCVLALSLVFVSSIVWLRKRASKSKVPKQPLRI